MDLQTIVNFFTIPSIGFNILDFIVLFIILFYAIEGYTLGFISASMDLLSFVLSFFLALTFYNPLSSVLISFFSLPQGFGKAIAFFLIALSCEIVFNVIFRRFIHRIPRIQEFEQETLHKSNHLLGIVPGIISAFIILTFIFSVIITLPSSPFLKNLVSSSQIGSKLVSRAQAFDKTINSVFGGALNETLTFLTIEPESNETVNLHFTASSATIDSESESEMLKMVNKERESRGLKALISDKSLQDLARDYSNDMFRRGYFSHNNPDGLTPFDRMEKAGIGFTNAGENLALAPSVDLSMQGLMNSPGHKANILSSSYNKVGIGVMDGGIYGKMFTQEFTD